MNVAESNNITNTISYLRRNIYNSPIFRGEFISKLSEYIYAFSVKFSPEQYGGWDVSIECDINKFNTSMNTHGYQNFLNKVCKALYKAITSSGVNDLSIMCDIVNHTSNLVNVTIVGPGSINIRI